MRNMNHNAEKKGGIMLLKGLMDICFIMYLTKMYNSFFQSLRGNSPGNCDIYGKIIGSHAVALPFSNFRLLVSLPYFFLL